MKSGLQKENNKIFNNKTKMKKKIMEMIKIKMMKYSDKHNLYTDFKFVILDSF